MKKPVYIIAEAGVNHNGSLEKALELCNAAKKAGVDCVKFQTWKTEKIITKSTPMAEYQAKNTESSDSQFDMLKKLELGYPEFKIIWQHCQKIGIDVLSTPDETDSLDFLVDELKMPIIKIGSGDITNLPYLEMVAQKQLPVILSTGMCGIAEVEEAVLCLETHGCPSLSLLHCTTNYPCPMNEVNLLAMNTLAQFGHPVGYSDHTLGLEVPVAAVALGATIIEKHFTLDKSMEGPDHLASMDPEELAAMVQAIRNIEQAMGSARKKPNPSEEKIKSVVQKSIVASRPIAKGETLNSSNMTAKRAGGQGISSKYWHLVLDRSAPRDFFEDEAIEL